MTECGDRVGPIWKCGGEVCVCILPPGHDAAGEWHRCSCGAEWVVPKRADA